MNPDLNPIATEHAQLAAFKAQADALGWTPTKAVAVADTAAVEALLDASFAAGYRPCAACGAMIGDRETQGVCYPCSQGQRERGPIYGASLAGRTPVPGFPTPTAGITVNWQAPSEPVPGDALRAVEAVWVTPVDACAKCADLAQQIVTLSSRCADLEDDKVDVDLVVQNRELVARVCQLQNQYTPTPCPDCAAVADRSEALAARIDDLLEQNDAQAIENSDLARQVVALRGHAERLAAQVRAGKGG